MNLFGIELPDSGKNIRDGRLARLAAHPGVSADEVRKLQDISQDVSTAAMIALTGTCQSVAGLAEKGVYTEKEAHLLMRAARVEAVVAMDLSPADRTMTAPRTIMDTVSRLDAGYAKGEIDRAEYDLRRTRMFERLEVRLDEISDGWRLMRDLHPQSAEPRAEGHEFMRIPELAPSNIEYFMGCMKFRMEGNVSFLKNIAENGARVYAHLCEESQIGQPNEHGNIGLLTRADVAYAQGLNYMLYDSSFSNLVDRLENRYISDALAGNSSLQDPDVRQAIIREGVRPGFTIL
jgi:hypothetical protein